MSEYVTVQHAGPGAGPVLPLDIDAGRLPEPTISRSPQRWETLVFDLSSTGPYATGPNLLPAQWPERPGLSTVKIWNGHATATLYVCETLEAATSVASESIAAPKGWPIAPLSNDVIETEAAGWLAYLTAPASPAVVTVRLTWFVPVDHRRNPDGRGRLRSDIHHLAHFLEDS